MSEVNLIKVIGRNSILKESMSRSFSHVIVTAIRICRMSCVLRATFVSSYTSLDFNAFYLSHFPTVWLGIDALLRGQDATASWEVFSA